MLVALLVMRALLVAAGGSETGPEDKSTACDSGVRRRATGCRIRGSCSTWARLKSKLTGRGPGEASEPVGESTNLVQCCELPTPDSGLLPVEVLFAFPFSVWAVPTIKGELIGSRTGGNCLGKAMLFLLNTTRCMAVQNSLRDKAPSFVTSLNCLYTRK